VHLRDKISVSQLSKVNILKFFVTQVISNDDSEL
jgi:hypothetical protein